MGGRGASSGAGNKIGGLSITLNGKQRNYFIDASGTLRDISSAEILGGRTQVGKAESTINNFVSQGKGTALTRTEVAKLKEERLERIANTPDYELGQGVGDNRANRRAARQGHLMTRTMNRKG